MTFCAGCPSERIEACLDEDSKVIAWSAPQRRSPEPLRPQRSPPTTCCAPAPFELGMGLIDMPFEIENIRCENRGCRTHAHRLGSGLCSNVPRAFAIQSMVGELAHATGRDQKEMLLQLIGTPRKVKLDSVKDPGITAKPFDSYPIDTGTARGALSKSLPKKAAGADPCRRTWTRHRRSPQLRQLYRRPIVEVSVDDKGQAHRSEG